MTFGSLVEEPTTEKGMNSKPVVAAFVYSFGYGVAIRAFIGIDRPLAVLALIVLCFASLGTSMAHSLNWRRTIGFILLMALGSIAGYFVVI